MDEPDYVRAIFDRNVSWAALNGKLKGRNVLELGPGNSVGTALLAACHGASAILVDSGDRATREVKPYQDIAKSL